MKLKQKFKQTEIGKIPEDWMVSSFKEVCSEIIDCSHAIKPKFLNEGDYIFLEVSNIGNDGFLDLSNVSYVSREDYIAWTKRLIPKENDIVITKTGRVGASSIIPKNVKICIGRNQVTLRANNELINSHYLWHYLHSIKYKEELKRLTMTGTILDSLHVKYIPQIRILLPSLNEQAKIASFLDAISYKIRLNNKMNKTLEAIGQAIFKKWFVDKKDENWKIGKLEEIIEKIESGRRPKGGIDSSHFEIPSIGAENILGLGEYNYSKTKFISKEFYNKMTTGIIKSKDVLLYKDGAKIGRKSLFMNNFPFRECCINEHVFILRSKENFSQFFLYFWLDQRSMTERIINLNSNAAQPGINQISVLSLPILIPDKATIEYFDLFIEPLISKIFHNCLQSLTLSQIRDFLLPKLMSGKVRVK